MERKRAEMVINDYCRLKRVAQKYYEKNNLERALKTISFASDFMFMMNTVLYDGELESLLVKIAETVINLPVKPQSKDGNNSILYYDWMDNISRGLTKIYLIALTKMNYEVKYVTYERNKFSISQVQEIINPQNVHVIKETSYTEQMKILSNIICESGADTAFLYLHPSDVVGVGTFSLYEGKIKRYLVNITDHTFWLGKTACDKVINFREFGYRVCKKYRNFTNEELAYIPYYPLKKEKAFQEFTFKHSDWPLIFSGGQLYKTQSKDNGYYKLIEKILVKNPEVNFLYLGHGDASKLYALMQKFPGRVAFSPEREDFFEVMKRCTVYLSTYPYGGGLMTQYALLAKKIPITLCHPNVEQELTIHHEKTFWNYEDINECCREIDRLLKDDLYRSTQECKLADFLINESQFQEELGFFLQKGDSIRRVKEKDCSIEGFQAMSLELYKGLKYERCFFRRKGLYLIWFFPIKYILGGIAKIVECKHKL